VIDFPASNLSPSIADDQLIASVLSYKAENAGSVYVATADVGLEIKLRSRGLQPLILSEELLPDEPDPLEQENRSLRRQLAERHTPVLTLVTEAPGRHPFTIAPEVTSPSAPTLEQVRREHPHIAPAVEPPAAAQGSTGLERLQADLLASARSMMHPRIVRYNDERETFLRQYEKYLADLKIWEKQRALTIGLELSVSNAGTAPASDIDVVLWFPDDLILLTKDDLPKTPKARRRQFRPRRQTPSRPSWGPRAASETAVVWATSNEQVSTQHDSRSAKDRSISPKTRATG
jgi:hypothetical protein